MTISDYFKEIKTLLLTDPLVENFQIVKERNADRDEHIRVRLTLCGNYPLEFSEYVQLSPNGSIIVTFLLNCQRFGAYSVMWDQAELEAEFQG